MTGFGRSGQKPTRPGWQSGQAVVEFALAALVFFMIVGAILDVSRAVWYQSTMQEAVQQATRFAIVHGVNSTSPIGPGDGGYSSGPPSTDATITTVVDRYAIGVGSAMTVTSSWPNGDNADGHQVTVTATYPFNPFTGFFNLVHITLTASSTRTIVN